jgi:hypothetical protein
VVSVEVLPWTKSDHNSLLVFFSKNNEMTWRKRRQFRYEASWEKHQEYSQLVKQVWRVWNNFELAWRKVRNNLKCCQRAFQKWVRKEGGKVEDQIVKKERELQLFQMQEDDFDIDKENQKMTCKISSNNGVQTSKYSPIQHTGFHHFEKKQPELWCFFQVWILHEAVFIRIACWNYGEYWIFSRIWFWSYDVFCVFNRIYYRFWN